MSISAFLNASEATDTETNKRDATIENGEDAKSDCKLGMSISGFINASEAVPQPECRGRSGQCTDGQTRALDTLPAATAPALHDGRADSEESLRHSTPSAHTEQLDVQMHDFLSDLRIPQPPIPQSLQPFARLFDNIQSQSIAILPAGSKSLQSVLFLYLTANRTAQ